MLKGKERFDELCNAVIRAENEEYVKRNILDFVKQHEMHQKPRLIELLNYYLGRNKGISDRQRRESHLADYRATHNFAKFITEFITGYQSGNDITIESEENQEYLTELNTLNNVNKLNSLITQDMVIFGRAYELVMMSDHYEYIRLNPISTFCIYDNTVKQNLIAGISYRRFKRDDVDVLEVDLYTQTERIYYEVVGDKVEVLDEQKNMFGDVQITEYYNNEHRMGDFEPALPQIDLYDIAQSDTANYMTDLNDALLKIEGDVDIDPNEVQAMKDRRVLIIRPSLDQEGRAGNVNGDYIYKKYDVQGSEAYKSRIRSDIHALTNTPDLSDENFGGVQSGQAMKYKLFGLEQLRATKEMYFEEGLRRRYRLIDNHIGLTSSNKIGQIKIEFNPNIPESMTSYVDNFMKMGGRLSQRTMLSTLPFIENPEKEIELIMQEDKEREEMYRVDIEHDRLQTDEMTDEDE